MPINKENSVQMGFSTTLEVNDTILDLCERIGISKSQFIRQAVKEKIWALIGEKKVMK